MAWPPRSPDLTPMDFFLWCHINALIYSSPVDFEQDRVTRIVEAAATFQAATWHLGTHMSISAPTSAAVYRGRWPYVLTSALNCYEIQLFSQNTSVILLDFQP